MGKYGKKISISLNPLDYNITILGEGGIGKTTLVKEMCEKLVGDEGYMHFDIGREDGASAIEGIVSEKIEDYAKMKEVIDDIIENKDADYPNLKVVIWDTLDEMIPILEAEAIREWNKGKPSDKKADTINKAWTGFGEGQKHACGYLLDAIWGLKSVGVSSIIIGHVKRSDMIDPISQETYSKLTADTTQKYFGWIKNKMHFVGLAYIDREIVKEKTGRKNIVTKQDVTINKTISESRVISFRDDTYSVDSKSRFADIIDKIPFGADEFIKAMTDAIENEKTNKGVSLSDAKKEQEIKEKNKQAAATEASANAKAARAEAELEDSREDMLAQIAAKFPSAEAEAKQKIKSMLKDAGFAKLTEPEVPASLLKQILDILA